MRSNLYASGQTLNKYTCVIDHDILYRLTSQICRYVYYIKICVSIEWLFGFS